ncbi:hypothetical protein PR048_031666 [Dryococelus australis]|uniref:Uncharacterized protein n=1 Tax=Dryococelus australis TaxID=614101 RepID=A0ABQ9G5Y3_9NEOP|nr:hypothetical protein PR048_031666 [Dryococelus australis]
MVRAHPPPSVEDFIIEGSDTVCRRIYVIKQIGSTNTPGIILPYSHGIPPPPPTFVSRLYRKLHPHTRHQNGVACQHCVGTLFANQRLEIYKPASNPANRRIQECILQGDSGQAPAVLTDMRAEITLTVWLQRSVHAHKLKVVPRGNYCANSSLARHRLQTRQLRRADQYTEYKWRTPTPIGCASLRGRSLRMIGYCELRNFPCLAGHAGWRLGNPGADWQTESSISLAGDAILVASCGAWAWAWAPSRAVVVVRAGTTALGWAIKRRPRNEKQKKLDSRPSPLPLIHQRQPMKVKRGEYGAAPDCKGGGNRIRPRKPADQRYRLPHDPQMRKSGSDISGTRTLRAHSCCEIVFVYSPMMRPSHVCVYAALQSQGITAAEEKAIENSSVDVLVHIHQIRRISRPIELVDQSVQGDSTEAVIFERQVYIGGCTGEFSNTRLLSAASTDSMYMNRTAVVPDRKATIGPAFTRRCKTLCGLMARATSISWIQLAASYAGQPYVHSRHYRLLIGCCDQNRPLYRAVKHSLAQLLPPYYWLTFKRGVFKELSPSHNSKNKRFESTSPPNEFANYSWLYQWLKKPPGIKLLYSLYQCDVYLITSVRTDLSTTMLDGGSYRANELTTTAVETVQESSNLLWTTWVDNTAVGATILSDTVTLLFIGCYSHFVVSGLSCLVRRDIATAALYCSSILVSPETQLGQVHSLTRTVNFHAALLSARGDKRARLKASEQASACLVERLTHKTYRRLGTGKLSHVVAPRSVSRNARAASGTASHWLPVQAAWHAASSRATKLQEVVYSFDFCHWTTTCVAPPFAVYANNKGSAVEQPIPSEAVIGCSRSCGGWAVRPLASHQGAPGSIPGRVTPGLLQVGIVPDDAAGRRVLSRNSRFPHSYISDAAPFSPHFTLIGSQDLIFKSRPKSLNSTTKLCNGSAPTTWSDYTPPPKANRVQFPAGSLPAFRTWESRRTITAGRGFFSRFCRFYPPLHSRAAPYSPLHGFRGIGDTGDNNTRDQRPVVPTRKTLKTCVQCSAVTLSCVGEICNSEGEANRRTLRQTKFNSRPGYPRMFVCGYRAGRCHWSAGFLGFLPFALPFHSGAPPYSPQSPSSALETSLLRVATLSSRTRRGLPAELLWGARRVAYSLGHAVATTVPFVYDSTGNAFRHTLTTDSLDSNPEPVCRKAHCDLEHGENAMTPYHRFLLRGLENRRGCSEVDIGRRRDERAQETGDQRENPPTSGVVLHDSHVRKIGE